MNSSVVPQKCQHLIRPRTKRQAPVASTDKEPPTPSPLLPFPRELLSFPCPLLTEQDCGGCSQSARGALS